MKTQIYQIAKYIVPLLVLFILIASMGWCWQMNDVCQQGKWWASALVYLAFAYSVIKNEKKLSWQLFFTLLAIIISLQIIDAYNKSWNYTHALSWVSLLLFFYVVKNLSYSTYSVVVGASSLVVLLAFACPYIGINVSCSLQLFDNPAGAAAAVVLSWSSVLPKIIESQAIKRNMGRVAFIALFILLSVWLYCQSRTGLVALFLSTIVYLVFTEKRLNT